MRARVLLIYTFILLVVGCKNEPYEITPLGVVSIVDHTKTPTTRTFQYHEQKLYTFFSRTPTDTLANMKFNFRNEILRSITSDSTKTSVKTTTFYNLGTSVVTDSTFQYEADTVIKVSARVVTYDDSGNPLSVDLKTWTDKGIKEELAELTWDDGNVVRLITSDITTGEKISVKDVSIVHDKEKCVYTTYREYLFTLGLQELYWLSKNNPVTFNDGTSQKTYFYWYNKLGYPSNFQDEVGTVYGAAYTQIR